MSETILFKNTLDSLQIKFLIGGLATCAPGWGFSNIKSQYNKLYYILQDQLQFTVKGRSYTAKAGDLVLLPANSVHSYKCASGNPLTKYWVHFSAYCGNKDLFQIISLPAKVHIGKVDKVIGAFESLLSLWPKTDMAAMILQKHILLDLIICYLQKANRNFNCCALDGRIEQAMEYISNNLAQPISSEDLGQITGLHPGYFTRLFKRQTGQTPMLFINNLRISKAKELLRSTDFPVNVVAVMVGIPNYSYFSRLFKSRVNFSPKEYRFLMQTEDKRNYSKAEEIS